VAIPSAHDDRSDVDRPFRRVFLSYRFGDRSRFDMVQQIAVRLRVFSIKVGLDQRSLDYGGDI
jgi:hypothetical protein